MAVFDIDPPQMYDNPDATTRYLYRLVEQLNYTLQHMDTSAGAQDISESARIASISEDIKSLRSMIKEVSDSAITPEEKAKLANISERANRFTASTTASGNIQFIEDGSVKGFEAANAAQIGAADGICPLDGNGQIATAYMPTLRLASVIAQYSNLAAGADDVMTGTLTNNTFVSLSGISSSNPDVIICSFKAGSTYEVRIKNIGTQTASGNITISGYVIQ
jgi:hypothetical protein